jgi:hypothetical protein
MEYWVRGEKVIDRERVSDHGGGKDGDHRYDTGEGFVARRGTCLSILGRGMIRGGRGRG